MRMHTGKHSVDVPATLEHSIDYTEGHSGPQVNYCSLMRKIGLQIFNVSAVFVMTFLVFPGVLVTIPNTYSMNNGWMVVLLIAEFNVFDTIGRFLAGCFRPAMFGPSKLHVHAALRFLMYGIFLMALKGVGFLSDSTTVIVMNAIFSFTNGYYASLAMMYGPDAADVHEKEAAGYIMSLFLNVSILFGSSVSTFLDQGVHVLNPYHK